MTISPVGVPNLVLVDETDPGLAAIRLAVSLADDLGAAVVLPRGIPPPEGRFAPSADLPALVDLAERRALDRLQGDGRAFDGQSGGGTETVLMSGAAPVLALRPLAAAA
jgi:hypothetical protein